MDPKTVKYVINYDERKQFKNIEFTDGEFIGVSVVGEDQTPAFAGSEFFTADDEFVKKMTILKNYCQNKENANTKMHTLEEFLKLSYGAISEKVNCAVNQAYSTEDTWIYMIDVFDDCAIFNFTNVKDGKRKLMKIGYSVAEDGTVFLGKINEVCVKYEDVEEKSENNGEQGTDKMTNAAGKTPVESTTPQVPTAPMPSTTATTAPATEALKTPETDNTIVKTETVPTAPTTATTAASATSAPAENKTVLNVNKTDNKEGLANGKTTPDTTSTTTLTTQSPDSSSTASATSKEPESKTDESDKKARLELLTSYKDYLSDEQ